MFSINHFSLGIPIDVAYATFLAENDEFAKSALLLNLKLTVCAVVK